LPVFLFFLSFELILQLTTLLVDVTLVVAPLLAELVYALEDDLLVALSIHLDRIVAEADRSSFMAVRSRSKLLRGIEEGVLDLFLLRVRLKRVAIL
jgi:hypothetical protein